MKNNEAIKVFETYLTTGYVPRPYELREASKAAIIALSSYEQMMKGEVDLEKEIDSEWKKSNPIDEGMGVESAYIHIEAFDMIARHFYELGRKQVLQEIYDGKAKPVDKITTA